MNFRNFLHSSIFTIVVHLVPLMQHLTGMCVDHHDRSIVMVMMLPKIAVVGVM